MSEGALAMARRLDRLTQSAALVGFSGLVAMALLIFYDGAARYVGVPRISGFPDYGELVFPIVIASCYPAGLLRQTNVTVRVIGQLAGPRANAVFEAFAALVTLAFFIVLAWQFALMTNQFAEGGRTTRTIEIPLAPWWWITTAIMAICVPVQVYVALAWIRAAVIGQTPAHSSVTRERHDGIGGS